MKGTLGERARRLGRRVPEWITLTVADNQTSTANGATTNSTDLAFPTVAGGIYAVEYFLIFGSSDATKDNAFRFTVGSGTQTGYGTVSTLGASLTQTHVAITAAGAASTNAITVGGQGTATNPVPARGFYSFNPSAATTQTLQFGNNTTGGANTVLMKGSWLKYQKLN